MLFMSAFYRASSTLESSVASGSGFNAYFSEGSDLKFQNDYLFTFHVESGELNGTGCSLALTSTHGHFSFFSNNETTLHAYTLDTDNLGFSCEGATFTGSNSSFTVSVPASASVTFVWAYFIPSYVDMYTTTAIGLGGIFLMVFSPTWVAWKIRKSGADVSTVERIGYGMLLFCVGFGLFVMWLWS